MTPSSSTKAQVINLIAVIFGTMTTRYGVGKHLATLSSQDTIAAIKLSEIANVFGILAFCIPKVAVALLLVRVMAPVQREKWFLYSMTGGVTIAGIINCIFTFVQCRPVSALWDPIIAATATCWNPRVFVNYTYFVGGPCPPQTSESTILIRTKRIPPSVTSYWLSSLYLSCGTSKCP